MTRESILEAAVGRGFEPEAAREQILALLRQVGSLEIESAARLEAVQLARRQAAALAERNAALAERNAALENGIKAISAQWGACFLVCPGRVFLQGRGAAGNLPGPLDAAER